MIRTRTCRLSSHRGVLRFQNSLNRAQPVGEGDKKYDGYRVSVVDTQALPEGVKVYHYPALECLLPEGVEHAGEFSNDSDIREYLIHGIVTRAAMATANIGDWIKA